MLMTLKVMADVPATLVLAEGGMKIRISGWVEENDCMYLEVGKMTYEKQREIWSM